MRNFTRVCVLFLAAMWPILATAQDDATKNRIDQFEKRLNEMEARHRAELMSRDEEIAKLKAMVEQQQATTHKSEIDKTREDILKDIDARDTAKQIILEQFPTATFWR